MSKRYIEIIFLVINHSYTTVASLHNIFFEFKLWQLHNCRRCIGVPRFFTKHIFYKYYIHIIIHYIFYLYKYIFYIFFKMFVTDTRFIFYFVGFYIEYWYNIIILYTYTLHYMYVKWSNGLFEKLSSLFLFYFFYNVLFSETFNCI